MPPIIAALGAAVAGAAATSIASTLIGGTILGSTWLATAAAALIGGVVAMGVGYGLSAVLGLNRVKSGGRVAAQDRKQTIRSSVAPRQVIYGTARASGPIVYASSTGASSQFLHLVIPVAGHRIEAVNAIWINDERIPIEDVSGSTGLVTAGRYANLVRMFWADGSQTTANSQLVAESTDGWSADHILRGTAYVYLRLEYNRDVFSNGPGTISFEVAGHREVFDPRNSTTGYSTNPALCILHYLQSPDGLACSADEIDTASFIAAANICDEFLQVVESGGTQERYKLDGVFNLEQKPIDVIEDMLTSCAGTLVYVAGKYRLYAGAYDAPSDSLVAADLAGDVELVTKPPRRELFNTVRGTFIDPSRNWQATEFPPYSEAEIVTADGEVIEKEVDWPFTIDEIRSQRLAKLTLRRAREALSIRVPVKYSGIRFSVWQTLNVTLDDFGWTNKPFRVVAWSFDVQSGIVNLTLREESATSYAWQFGDASPLPLAPDTDLVDPLAIPAPTGVTLSASTALQADGSVAPALLVTWTAAAFAFVVAHEVQWRVAGGDWNSATVPLGTDRLLISPVIIGATYEVRVRAVTGLARGAWSGTVSTVAAGDTTEPNAPSGLQAVGVLRAISVTWTLPTALDLDAIEVFENTTSSTTGRVLVGEADATNFLRTGLASAVTRFFWVRSRDRSGNLSAFVGPVSATTLTIATDDIAAGAVDYAKFAAEIRPVATPVVAAELLQYRQTNQIIFPQSEMIDTSTSQTLAARVLYRWTGSVWVALLDSTEIRGTLADAQIAAVAAAKVTGQITSTQITDLAISTPKLAAGAVETAKIAAGAVVADKIATNAVTAAKIDALAVTAEKIAANAVIAGKIAAGAISATEIAAGAITTSKLAVTGGSVLMDSSFDDTAGFWTVDADGFAIEDNNGTNAVTTLGVRRAAVLFHPTYSGVTLKAVSSSAFGACAEGQVYRLRAVGLNTNTTRTVSVQIYAVDRLGVLVGSAVQLEWLNQATALTKEAQFTVPAGGVRLRVVVSVAEAGGTAWTGTAAIGDITVVQAATGAMIVDGAIKAEKIFAGTITANEIEVEGITKTFSAIAADFYGNVDAWNDIATFNYTCTNGARRVLLVSVECSDESEAGTANVDSVDWQSALRMKIAGTVQTGEVDTHCSNGTTTALTWSFLDDTTTRSGSVAFVIQGYAENFGGATRTKTGWRDPTMTIMEFKR